MNFLSQLTGCFAQPAAENPTVAMVEAAYRHHGLDWRYINCEVAPERLGDAVRGARAMGWRGFNCSIPHKLAVIEHLDGLGRSAEIIGAVNCAVARDRGFIGENTDGKGFVESLRGLVPLDGIRLVVLGAGGAARAIAVEAALAGAAQVTIVNRSAGPGEALAALVADRTPAAAEFRAWAGAFDVPDGTDVLVNATSIGLHPDTGLPPVDPNTLARRRWSPTSSPTRPRPVSWPSPARAAAGPSTVTACWSTRPSPASRTGPASAWTAP
jgi:shikimate dehydrogenase